jgi:hypothetical protein
MAGSVDGSGDAAALLGVGLPLAGDVTGAGTLDPAQLETVINLAGVAEGEGFIDAPLEVLLPLAGAVTGAGSITGDLYLALTMSGALTGNGIIMGDLVISPDPLGLYGAWEVQLGTMGRFEVSLDNTQVSVATGQTGAWSIGHG